MTNPVSTQPRPLVPAHKLVSAAAIALLVAIHLGVACYVYGQRQAEALASTSRTVTLVNFVSEGVAQIELADGSRSVIRVPSGVSLQPAFTVHSTANGWEYGAATPFNATYTVLLLAFLFGVLPLLLARAMRFILANH